MSLFHHIAARWILVLAVVCALASPAEAREQRLSPKANAKKFARVAKFKKRYRRFVKDIEKTLKAPEVSREVAVAAIATIMNHTSMRVGSECYAKPKDKSKTPSFGASSLRRSQVRVRGNTVYFAFNGKSHVDWKRKITDAKLATVVKLFLAQPGKASDRLWQLPTNRKRKGKGKGKKRRAKPINEVTMRGFFAQYGGALPKDLRTHLANETYQVEIAKLGKPRTKDQAARNQKTAIARTAKFMGHESDTCRINYLKASLLKSYGRGLR